MSDVERTKISMNCEQKITQSYPISCRDVNFFIYSMCPVWWGRSNEIKLFLLIFSFNGFVILKLALIKNYSKFSFPKHRIYPLEDFSLSNITEHTFFFCPLMSYNVAFLDEYCSIRTFVAQSLHQHSFSM